MPCSLRDQQGVINKLPSRQFSASVVYQRGCEVEITLRRQLTSIVNRPLQHIIDVVGLFHQVMLETMLTSG